MCEPRALNQVKLSQLRIPPLECLQSTNCWCAQLSFKAPLTQVFDECLSPSQFLNEYSSQLSYKDTVLLKSLQHRKFIK